MKIVVDLESRIARLEERVLFTGARKGSQRNYGCAAFGVKSVRELAELFVEEFERRNVAPTTFPASLNRLQVEGHRSRVRGKLFHLFVRNFEPLQKDFLENAVAQVKELNDPELRGYPPTEPLPQIPRLLNARGEKIQKPVRFGRPRKAERVRIIKRNGRAVEFVDDMYVSYADEPCATLWTFLSEIEVKTAGAANGFGKQIGFSQSRVGADDVREVEMVVEGFKAPVKVTPEHILFSQRSIDRNAVTFFSKRNWALLADDARHDLARAMENGDMEDIYRQSDFRYQVTTIGHGDVFRRITLAVHIDYFDSYVQAIWPAVWS